MVEHVAYEVVELVQRHGVMFWMVFCSVKKKNIFLEGALSSSKGSWYICWAHKSSPSQVPTALLTTALLTTALILLWLSLQEGDPYSNHCLKDVAIFSCID